MAGAKDYRKRTWVRKHLQTKDGRTSSDRKVAEAFAVSRALVKAVRVELIASGLHPTVKSVKFAAGRDLYQPGQTARGGYVFTHEGKIVPIATWKRMLARDPVLMAKYGKPRQGKSR
jgi:hypothetical protein